MAQMIRCPLTGLTCGKAVIVQEKTFFLSEPEKPEHDRERRWKAIKAALGKKYHLRSALSEKQPIAFNCKICEMIQCSAYGMADISTQNPNVLLELGMMLGLGKPAIILCKKGQEEQLRLPSNLNAIEVVPFQDYIDIIDDVKHIAATLPPPLVPPTPISEIESLRPSLAEELRGESDATVKEFDRLIKEAKLDSVAPREEKVDISPALESRLGNVEESLKRLERLGFATDADTAFYRGNLYYERQEYEAALEQYNWCLKLNPAFPEALNNRGATYNELKRYKEAIDDLDKAISLRPDYIAAIGNRGNTDFGLQNYASALQAYNRVLKLKPDDNKALTNRAVTYDHLQRYDDALDDFNRALELIPDDPEILNNRGVAYIRLQRYDEALADLNRALELKPDSPSPLYNLACLFSLMDKPQEAISHLEKAIARDEKYRRMATEDSDFDNIRNDPRFRKLTEGA